MNDAEEAAFIAAYDQKRGQVDEFLTGLVKIVQRGTQPPTVAYLKLWAYLRSLDSESVAVLATSAVIRIADREPP